MFQTKFVEKIKTHALSSITFFEYEIMWKNTVVARQVTDDNMVHAHCMLDT
jgi:hypothetical protein